MVDADRLLIQRYQLRLYGDANYTIVGNYKEIITLYLQDTIEWIPSSRTYVRIKNGAIITFHPDDTALQDNWVNSWPSSRSFRAHCWAGRYDRFVDMLRQERPCYFTFTENGLVYLQTSEELTGEGEVQA